MKPQDISIKESIYKLAVPERARTVDKMQYGQAFKQFVELFGAKFDELKKQAEQFPRIVDVDECPPELLPFLGELVGSDFDYTEDVELQREQMKTLIKMYREKGTPTSILDIVYKYDPRAVIFEPYEYMSRFNVSRHSGRHHYANRTYWNTGVFEIRMYAGSADKMRQEVLKMRPAGTRMWVHYTHEFEFDNGDPVKDSFVSRVDMYTTTLQISLPLQHLHALSGSLRGTRQKLSGNTFAFGVATVALEMDAKAFRTYQPNPLFTWEDALANQPGLTATSPIYYLGYDSSIAKSLDMEAAYPEGTFVIPENGFGVSPAISMTALAAATAEDAETTRVYDLGLPAARRKVIGSPLYTFEALSVEHPHIDTVYPGDPSYGGSPTVTELREPIVGSFIEYQDDVQITITT